MLDMAALQARAWVERRRKTERGGSVPATCWAPRLSVSSRLPASASARRAPLPASSVNITSRGAELDEQKRGEKRRLRGLAEAHAHNGSAVFGCYGGGHGARLLLPAKFRFP